MSLRIDKKLVNLQQVIHYIMIYGNYSPSEIRENSKRGF